MTAEEMGLVARVNAEDTTLTEELAKTFWTYADVAQSFSEKLVEESGTFRPALKISGHLVEIRRERFERNIQYNHEDFNLLGQAQEYTIADVLQLSLQMYENEAEHFRLFAFSPKGLLFSVNTTVAMRGSDPNELVAKFEPHLALMQRGPKGADAKAYAAYKRERTRDMVAALLAAGLAVDSSNNVHLGAFDSKRGRFLDAAGREQDAQGFLDDFLIVCLIKGHFMENKGYQLNWLPAARSW
jgi:hypothetical protein